MAWKGRVWCVPRFAGNGSTPSRRLGERVVIKVLGSLADADLLRAEWQALTGHPFVFACWVANRELPAEWEQQFSAVCQGHLFYA